jgi:hypothetical protein
LVFWVSTQAKENNTMSEVAAVSHSTLFPASLRWSFSKSAMEAAEADIAVVTLSKPESFDELSLALEVTTQDIQLLKPHVFAAEQAFQGRPTSRNRNLLLDQSRRLHQLELRHEQLVVRTGACRALLCGFDE